MGAALPKWMIHALDLTWYNLTKKLMQSSSMASTNLESKTPSAQVDDSSDYYLLTLRTLTDLVSRTRQLFSPALDVLHNLHSSVNL